MESKKVIGEISELLGPKGNRYFSNGYKSIEILYGDFAQNDGNLFTTIQAKSGGSWSKKNEKNMSPHLGTTEFIAIAAVMTQHLLEKEMQLSNDEIERSWISRFVCKIKQCTEIDQHYIPVSSKVVSTEVLAGFLQSQVQIQIGTLQATLFVCHPPAGSSNQYKKDAGSINLYQKGYKLRDLSIYDVVLDRENKTSSGNVFLYEENIQKNGIGAKYPGMILTDLILVTGQLAQALLYNLNGKDRENSNNMWLREVDVRSDIPPREKVSNSKVTFHTINNVTKNNEIWQSIALTCSLGNMYSKAKIAQKLN